MTSRSLNPDTTGSGTAPGARPHLPPVEPAATSRRADRKAPLGWLPWLLLGLLLLTLLAVALLARAVDGSDSASSGAVPSDTAAEQPAADGPAAPQPADAGGTLTAAGQDLLALPTGQLAGLKGEKVSGAATVESVVADEGFWVGSGPDARVFVHLSPQARRSLGESGFQVGPGQTVDVAGAVAPSSAEFARSVGVDEQEGSAQLVEQGAYVEATEIRLSD